MSQPTLLGEVGVQICELNPNDLVTAKLVGAVATCGFIGEPPVVAPENLPDREEAPFSLSNN